MVISVIPDAYAHTQVVHVSFPSRHVLLTFRWNTALGEKGQCGIRFRTTTLPTQTALNNIHLNFAGFWSDPLSRINTEFGFTDVKAALIDPEGTYPPTVPPMYSVGAIAYGSITSGPYFPLQVSGAMTLTTAVLRGKASKGRIYLPPIASVLDASNFRWPNSRLVDRCGRFATALTAMNGNMSGPAVVMSRIGAGDSNAITGVKMGNRPDIQRSRDNAVPEVYSAISAV